MAEESILKPVSYRIDDATKEKIKAISEDLQLNQQGTIQKLIEAFELQKGKSLITNAQEHKLIETFEYHTSYITQTFLSLLKNVQDADEKAEYKVLEQLQSKDAVILDLQKRLERLENERKVEKEKANHLVENTEQLNNTISLLTSEYKDKTSSLEKMLQDKENLNRALSDSCNELKIQLDQYKAQLEHGNKLQEEVATLKAQLNSTLHEKELTSTRLEQQLQGLRDKLQQEIQAKEAFITSYKEREEEALQRNIQLATFTLEKTLLEKEKEYQAELQSFKEQKQLEIERYQEKYLTLLERVQEKQI